MKVSDEGAAGQHRADARERGLLRHRAGQSQIPGERGRRDAGRRLLRGGRSLLHGAALRAGEAFCHRHQADGGEDPLLGVEELLDFVPEGCTPVLVDLDRGATPCRITCTPRAFYIFGPEDGTLEPARFAAVKEVIYVPTQGCMNLAASVNVILYDRLAKTLRAKG